MDNSISIDDFLNECSEILFVFRLLSFLCHGLIDRLLFLLRFRVLLLNDLLLLMMILLVDQVCERVVLLEELLHFGDGGFELNDLRLHLFEVG